jgi:hypothetical protein
MVAEGEWPRPSGGPPGAGASAGGGQSSILAVRRCRLWKGALHHMGNVAAAGQKVGEVEPWWFGEVNIY